MKKFETSILIAFILTLIFCVYTNAQQSELSKSLIRMHIIANSDSAEDQNLKLDVRDRLLKDFFEPLSAFKTAEEAKSFLENNASTIKNICEDELKGKYPVQVSLTTENYPLREYEGFKLPAGDYLSLRVIIGGGACGRNPAFSAVCNLFAALIASE